jgi:ribosomal protein S18 acetylase RimI-like enzyme
VIHIAPAITAEHVEGAAHLFDGPARPDAVRRFLEQSEHHLLLATWDGDPRPAGFVSGVETTHPDKGTEMFLYELAVDEQRRGQGIGAALVEALADLARSRGCYGMWVLTDLDNDAALATYRRGGATAESTHVMLGWIF